MSALAQTPILSENMQRLLVSVRAGFAPPPRLTISQFADKEIVLTTGPLAGTHWQTSHAPYQREIMDSFHEPGVEIVVVMGSSQWGKTAILVNVAGYHMAHDPCPILVVEPTLDPMAKDFSKNRMDPVIKASPALRKIVSKRREKLSDNTVSSKMFKGGILAVAGANSAASLASRSIRVLLLDEIDRYPVSLPGEGNTISIAFKRTTTYRRRRRIGMFSSPTIVNGPIHTWFKRGDQRHYYVPCVSCGVMHTYEWSNVKWTNRDPKTARIHCPECGYGMDDAERVAVLSRGEWRSEQERRDNKIVSFHLWEAYSPFSSLEDIVEGFLRARETQKKGDSSEMHTWENTTLGQPVEQDEGEGVEAHVLMARRETFESDVPEGVACLTAGIDTQNDRLEALVLGWGIEDECWLIDRQDLPGDPAQPEVWELFDELLGTSYQHPSGHRLPISASCIDSAGNRTNEVYNYVAKNAAKRLYAIIGRDGSRPIVSSPSRRKWGKNKRPVPLYTIGVDPAKSLLIDRLKLTQAGPGFIHIPATDWADEELAEQLTSERLVTRWHKGKMVSFWKKTRPRNEMLDCWVYALAAQRLLHPDIALFLSRLGDPVVELKSPPRRVPDEDKKRWVPRRRGWLQ